MSISSPFRQRDTVEALAARLRDEVDRPLRFMEVCGTHTMALWQHGLRSLFPKGLELVSGPGCPVCVTSQGEIDWFMALAAKDGVKVATFGDLMRIPGARGSLAQARAKGASVQVVYSPWDALEMARLEPGATVSFLAVGFETTAPLVASMILSARRMEIDNLVVASAHKTMPAALDLLLSRSGGRIDGLLCPGHVSVITGSDAYVVLSSRHRVPMAVAGFEPADIMAGILALSRAVKKGEAGVINLYGRAVTPHGNARAREVMYKVFQASEAWWRGLGPIAGSGLSLRPEWKEFDAAERFGIYPGESIEPPGCRCGEVLSGTMAPDGCSLFGVVCTPASPVGPCMVSSEGACAACHRYGDDPRRGT